MQRSKRNTGLAAVRKLGNAAIAGVEAARESAALRVGEARDRTVKAVPARARVRIPRHARHVAPGRADRARSACAGP